MEFQGVLFKYYNQLIDKFDNLYDYLEENPDNNNAIKIYEKLIKEISEVERLVNYYKTKESDINGIKPSIEKF